MAKSTRQRPAHPPARRSGTASRGPARPGGSARGGGGRGGGGGGGPSRGRSRPSQGRSPWSRVVIPGALVLVVVVVLIVVATSGGGGKPASSSGPDRVAAPASVVSGVTGVPATVFDQVGVLQGLTAPSAVKQGSGASALTSGGLPEVLYLGDEWCPVCATERWPVAVALSRFGTFSNLHLTRSSSTDSDPDTNTLSFFGSSYTSPYLVFDPIEMQDRNGNNLIPTPTAQLSLEHSLGATGVPFIDFAGKYELNTASFNPGVLQGLTWQQIASDLAHPSDSQGQSVQQGVIGSANQLSAVLCRITGNQPAAVCSSTGVKVAAAALSSSG